MRTIVLFCFVMVCALSIFAQEELPVRGLAIKIPEKENVDKFVRFIHEELAPRKINTLILRVDYDFEYESHPELRNETALSRKEIEKLVKACAENHIEIVPQINLLGHQSWHYDLEKLLEVYPEFDETPHVKFPENTEYKWPNDDGLYCKSYCPLHPEVHKVVFELVDELLEAFGATKFHAGMDEVFYIADEKCPRCGGKDPAEIFAYELTTIRNHLALTGKQLWIWGDRLIDGKTTGIGMWEGSMNNTHRAIDLILKDVFICDWHYERADPTAAYFAMKGFSVATCPWRNSSLALKQKTMIQDFRAAATPELKERYAGMIQTVWSPVNSFFNRFYSNEAFDPSKEDDAVCFKVLFPK